MKTFFFLLLITWFWTKKQKKKRVPKEIWRPGIDLRIPWKNFLWGPGPKSRDSGGYDILDIPLFLQVLYVKQVKNYYLYKNW